MKNAGYLMAGVLALTISAERANEAAAAEGNANEWPKIESAIAADPEVEARVQELLDRMTLEQKVGQIIQGEIASVTPEDVKAFHLGSVLNGGGSYPGGKKDAGASDWVAAADAYYDASMDASGGGIAIPVIWGTDAVHGHSNVMGATLFPHNVGLGATRNPDLVRRIAEATAREVAATGLDWTFAPTVAVTRDDRWGRAYESYSEDPALVASLAGPIVSGLQGDGASGETFGPANVVATAKHFIGDGGTELGRDRGNVVMDEDELREVHGAGYQTALAAGAQTVMASYNSWNNQRMHGNRYLLTDVLKDRMGFDGFVIGDWNGHTLVPGCSDASCPAAINAGVDMIMVPTDWKAFYGNTLAQVRAGDIAEERLDDAVRRILRVKVRAGLFDKGRPSSRPLAGKTEWIGHPDHRALARKAVRESLVLLKNDGGILPLDPSKTILVAGDGADNIAKQSGGWTLTWQGTDTENADFPGATSIYAGIRDAVEAAGGQAILSPDGDVEMPPDAAIVVFGEEPYAEMPGDVASIDYQPGDRRDLALLKRLKAQGIPVVAVFLTGRPRAVNSEINAADAFVTAWLPGSEGGGVADVLLRAADGSTPHDFTGKLPVSWPAQADQVPVNTDGQGGSSGGDAQFPYGFGLTYSDRTDPAPLPEAGGSDGGDNRGGLSLFHGRAMPPLELYAGDGGAWNVTVFSGGVEPEGGQPLKVVEVSRQEPKDALQITWPGNANGHVFLQGLLPVDASAISTSAPDVEDTGVLSMTLRVDAQPTAEVFAQMDCGTGCSASVPLGQMLGEVAPGEWTTVTVDLGCFIEAGARLDRLETPFRLHTAGRTTLSLSDVRLEPSGAKAANLSCVK